MRNALGWLVLVATPCLAASVFRASVVKVDITPDGPQWLLGYDARQSNGVHDRISHRVVAMHDGQTEFVLVSSDLALISPAFYDEFTADLERETGIRRLQVWWTVTHTHSAPGNFAVGLKEQLVFPEIDYDSIDRIRGMDVIITTTARTDQEARALLRALGVPFRTEAGTRAA